LLFVVLCLLPVPEAAASVRYAGHVAYTSTQCCGFQDAVFKVFGRSDVRYRVCVQRPGGTERCKAKRTGASGVPSHAAFEDRAIGEYRVVWKVSGKVRDTARYIVSEETV
jgi:hypothetical protein